MKLLITSGGTTEAIDRVRGITNHATGTLGKLIAESFLEQNHQVTLVTTAAAKKPAAHPRLTIIIVTDVASLEKTLRELVPTHEALIHSMAVSDYSPVYMTNFEELETTDNIRHLLQKRNKEAKISSKDDYQVLFLKKTPKVIAQVKTWNPNIILVGFKLLVNVSQTELLNVAQESLQQNKADYILANDLTSITEKEHHAYLVSPNTVHQAKTKFEIAQLIYEKVVNHD